MIVIVRIKQTNKQTTGQINIYIFYSPENGSIKKEIQKRKSKNTQ